MDIDARIIQPALNPALNALSKFPSTGYIGDPFGEVDATCLNYCNYQPNTGGQVAQVCPIPWLTDPVVQGMVERRVFLSILVRESTLMPECLFSLRLVKSKAPLASESWKAKLLSVNQGAPINLSFIKSVPIPIKSIFSCAVTDGLIVLA